MRLWVIEQENVAGERGLNKRVVNVLTPALRFIAMQGFASFFQARQRSLRDLINEPGVPSSSHFPLFEI
jgi:hypothetical protein